MKIHVCKYTDLMDVHFVLRMRNNYGAWSVHVMAGSAHVRSLPSHVMAGDVM